jgi:hypothetical protein
VGKTTLLTSIYEEFKKINHEVNFEFLPESDTEEILQKNLAELQSMGDEITAKEGARGIAGTAAVAGPDSLPKFIFNLSTKTQGKKLQLTFRDYPGSYVLSANSVGQEFLKKLLRESAAAIVAIDTPAMIVPHKPDSLNSKNWDLRTDSGKWHDARNHPEEILDLFKSAYSRLDEPKLVILAPVKCETYVQTPDLAEKLSECIKDKYAPLLDFLSDPTRKDKVAVVITPVQTVGCLLFSRFYTENFNRPRFVFRKNHSSDTYNPQGNDHLLRYLLSFLLNLHNQGQIYERSPILRTIRSVFHQENDFERAVKQFARTRKTTDGFTILQGHDLLWIK